jgi:predicted transcriptional regulator
MDYTEVSRGLNKLREFEVVQVEPEERTQGGIRYRYFDIDEPAYERFKDSVKVVEKHAQEDRKKKAYWAARKSRFPNRRQTRSL